jgi:hypothetical protein
MLFLSFLSAIFIFNPHIIVKASDDLVIKSVESPYIKEIKFKEALYSSIEFKNISLKKGEHLEIFFRVDSIFPLILNIMTSSDVNSYLIDQDLNVFNYVNSTLDSVNTSWNFLDYFYIALFLVINWNIYIIFAYFDDIRLYILDVFDSI